MKKISAPETNATFKEEKHIVFGALVTCSKEMLQILDLAKQISHSDTSVLLTGESGTGKELVARAIHNHSRRKNGPFVVVNCASMPDTLIESELFGHEKGSFTDAVAKQKGKFELAHEGTIFLDEIGDLSPIAQPKVLRAVEEKKFMRVGGQNAITSNCRIIAATNKDLLKEVRENRFREDLYYRLCEIRLELPPLSKRRADIPHLVNHFIKQFNQEFGKNVKGASNIVLSYLMKYHWPGNIRELRSIIKIGMSLASKDALWLEDLPFKVELMSESSSGISGHVIVDESNFPLDVVEKKHILMVLNYCRWNKKQAAAFLKISRPTLDRKISYHRLTRTDI